MPGGCPPTGSSEGVNGNYGTGIQGMVTASDRWTPPPRRSRQVYMNNMGAYYGSEESWEEFARYAFEAALSRTDAVVQPRQSNTWGCPEPGSCV